MFPRTGSSGPWPRRGRQRRAEPSACAHRPWRRILASCATSRSSSPSRSSPAADASPPAGLPAGTWIDLSHDFSSETIYWPTARPFTLEVVSAQQTPGGYYYAANNICAAEHGGTHLDAPVHFAEGRETTDRVPLERLIGEAAVVDVSAEAARDRDYRLDVRALEAWEAAHGRIGEGTIVLVRTDWSKFWPDKERYLGTTKTGQRGGGQPPLSRHRLDRRGLAGQAEREGRRHRYTQHRLRPVTGLHDPPDPVRGEHSRRSRT